MNPWWLLIIIPLSATMGFLAAALLANTSCTDCRDAERYERAVAESEAYNAGFNNGLSKFSEVG